MELVLMLILIRQEAEPQSARDAASPPTAPAFRRLRPERRAPQEGPQEPPPLPEPPGRRAPREPDPVKFRAGLDLTYNSNILRLSDRDLDRLEDGSRPEKFRIDEPDDLIASPWAEAALAVRLFDDPSLVGLRAQAFVYTQNSVASHQEVAVFFKHRPWEFTYALRPEVYRREYRNLDTGEFESAFYTEHRFEGTVETRPFDVLRADPKLGLEFRDYDAPFNHRDSMFYTLGVELVAEALPWLDVTLEYEFVRNDAFASDFQPDTSYVEHGLEPGVAVRPVKDLELVLRYLIAAREYTTGNSPAVDPGHADRSDDRRRTTLRARWRASALLSVEAEARFTNVDTSLPNDSGATDEETTWSRDEVTLGVTLRF
jgi:hypothetical protein